MASSPFGVAVDVVVVTSDELDAGRQRELRALWDRAFGTERFSDEDADHAYGGVHVMALDGERVVAHASAIPRQIRFGTGPWRAVATSRPWPPSRSVRARASAAG